LHHAHRDLIAAGLGGRSFGATIRARARRPDPLSFGTDVANACVLDHDGEGLHDLVVDGSAGHPRPLRHGRRSVRVPINMFPYFGETSSGGPRR
jgi:hypothetical protein